MFSALQTIAPPAQEPVSVALLKQHTRVDNDADDALVAIYITAARQWIENYLGRALATQQLLWTMSQTPPPQQQPYLSLPLSLLVLPLWYTWPNILNNAIQLPRQPVISVDAVSYGQFGEDDTVLVQNTDFYVDTTTAQILINASSVVCPSDHLSVEFTTGYGPVGGSTTYIPQPIVQAIMMFAAYLYENRGDVAGGDPPSVVFMLLSPYRLISFG